MNVCDGADVSSLAWKKDEGEQAMARVALRRKALRR